MLDHRVSPPTDGIRIERSIAAFGGVSENVWSECQISARFFGSLTSITVMPGAGALPGSTIDSVILPKCEANSTCCAGVMSRSEEHTSELQSLMRISYAVYYLKKKTK